MKKAYKIPLIILGVVIGLLLVVSLVAGPIVKNYIEKHDKALLGREVSIKRVGVNLFVGKVSINELILFEDDGTTPFLQFDHLETKVDPFYLFDHCLWVRKALLSGLKVNVEQNHDWFNFNSLLEFFSSDDSEVKDSDFGMVFNNVTLEKGSFRYADLALDNEFNVNDIALHLSSLDLSELDTDVGLDLNFADSATLHTDLRLSENAKKYFINLKLKNLDVESINPYLRQYLPIECVGGVIDLDIDAQGLTDHIFEVDMKGSLACQEMVLQNAEGQPMGSIDSVLLIIQRICLKDRVLDIEKFYCSGLDLAYVIASDSTTNFDLVWNSIRPADSAEMVLSDTTSFTESDEEQSWKISVEDLEFCGARLFYEDHTLPETFHYELSDISLTSKHFFLDEQANMQLHATLNKVGKLHLKWQGSLNDLDNHNLTLMLSNVKVADFSPYTIQFFGVPVENGTLSFHSQNVVSDGFLNGINKLQIASAVFGNKDKSVHPLYEKVPLKLGLYLLTDNHHNASLDLPVSGNIHDPSFSYRKALGKVFSNLLTKVAASPFRLMTDEENNLKYIPFDPLQFDFTPEQYVMLDNVVATLQSRSDMSIILEEQVQYEEVINQLCIMQLKFAYYFSEHPDMKPSDLDFLTNEAIHSIKLTDKGLCEYAAQYSEKHRLHSKKDLTSVAWDLYHEKSEQILPRLMTKRNEILSDYLWKANGLTPEQISVTTIDESLLKSFAKPSRYEMHVFTYEDME